MNAHAAGLLISSISEEHYEIDQKLLGGNKI